MTVILVGTAGAAQASASTAPLFAISNEEARGDYIDAILAIEDRRYDLASQHLFGPVGDPAGVFNDKPQGFITKFFASQIENNPTSRKAAYAMWDEARKRFNKWIGTLEGEDNSI